MDRIPTPRELQIAARACVLLSYATGLGGIAAGTWLLRGGDWPMAIVLWLITFAVGAALMGISLLIRALSGLGAQLTRLESDVRVLAEERAQGGRTPGGNERDPWLRH
ncbi:MAG: hypothetical protein EA340_06770 [Nitriliruptor sp.]|nr:MAG: hypothetical protein EA340_06770 [Nitriliruptor sp.]TVR22224.1 MAG: hypothetical protein EA387_09030 [Nitriliruptor sp.]